MVGGGRRRLRGRGFLTTLAVGAVLVSLTPAFTRARMARVVADPVGSLVSGLVCLVFVVLVTVVLVFTVVGIVVAVPFAVAAFAVWAVGSAVAFLAVGDRLVGHEEGWLRPLLVGAAVNGALTVTGLGALLSFCVGAAGFGAVLRDWLENWK
ncbi:MAG: hypothetical protein ABEJ42_00880 [Halobacteriaceae archaeon]